MENGKFSIENETHSYFQFVLSIRREGRESNPQESKALRRFSKPLPSPIGLPSQSELVIIQFPEPVEGSERLRKLSGAETQI